MVVFYLLKMPFVCQIIQHRLKDVIAEKGRGKGGQKAVSQTVYKQFLEKNFATVHGQTTPKWAQLSNKEEKKPKKDSDDEDDDDDKDHDLTKVLYLPYTQEQDVIYYSVL